jgi:hypothetical protein
MALLILLFIASSGEGASKDKKKKAPPAKVEEAAPAKDEQLEERKIVLSNHGELILKVPQSWKQSKGFGMEGMPAATFFTPEKGDEFEVQLLPLWSPDKKPGFNSPSELRRLVEMDAGVSQATEAEKEARISTIKGVSGTGYYYFDTVFAKSPGGPDQAMKGSIAIDDLMVNFTVTCRSKDAPIVAQLLKILTEAKRVR